MSVSSDFASPSYSTSAEYIGEPGVYYDSVENSGPEVDDPVNSITTSSSPSFLKDPSVKLLWLLVSSMVAVQEGSCRYCPTHTGIYPNVQNCKCYYKCVQGVPIQKWCPPGQKFDVLSMTCTFPSKTVCAGSLMQFLPGLISNQHGGSGYNNVVHQGSHHVTNPHGGNLHITLAFPNGNGGYGNGGNGNGGNGGNGNGGNGGNGNGGNGNGGNGNGGGGGNGGNGGNGNGNGGDGSGGNGNGGDGSGGNGNGGNGNGGNGGGMMDMMQMMMMMMMQGMYPNNKYMMNQNMNMMNQNMNMNMNQNMGYQNMNMNMNQNMGDPTMMPTGDGQQQNCTTPCYTPIKKHVSIHLDFKRVPLIFKLLG